MPSKIKFSSTRRGDTIIEVMFAIAVFSLVAVITVSMMNLGTANAEGALELVTARNELNAQAEALRFVHSAYTAELALPECTGGLDGTIAKGQKCQQYKELWEGIVGLAEYNTSSNDNVKKIIDITETIGNNDTTATPEFDGVYGCQRVYQDGSDGQNLLDKTKAFVLNTRDMTIKTNYVTKELIKPKAALITATPIAGEETIFTPTQLGARIIYSTAPTDPGHDDNDNTDNGLANRDSYNYVAKVEGIWVVGVKGDSIGASTSTPFYDFYIQTCWNAPNSLAPTILDTVIRLYNPGVKD